MITYKNKKTKNATPSQKERIDKMVRDDFEKFVGEAINRYKTYGLYKSAKILRVASKEFKINTGGV